MKFNSPNLLGALFLILLGFGAGLGLKGGYNSAEKGGILGINHIAIVTKDFEMASSYYRDTLGFPVAIELKDEDGNPAWTYFQVSKTTFIELIPESATRPAGLEHFGLETCGTESLLIHLRELGIDAKGPRISSISGIHFGSTKDIDGVPIEFIGTVPGSLHKRAIDNWDNKK